MAVRHSIVSGLEVNEGEYIGILDGELVSSCGGAVETMLDMIGKIEDIDLREIVTLFVGDGVSDEARVAMTEAIEERFEDLSVDVYIGGQEIYEYLIAIE